MSTELVRWKGIAVFLREQKCRTKKAVQTEEAVRGVNRWEVEVEGWEEQRGGGESERDENENNKKKAAPVQRRLIKCDTTRQWLFDLRVLQQ